MNTGDSTGPQSRAHPAGTAFADQLAVELSTVLAGHPEPPFRWDVTVHDDGAPGRQVVVSALRTGLLGEIVTVGRFRITAEHAVWDLTAERSPEGRLVRAGLDRLRSAHFPTAVLTEPPPRRFQLVRGPDDRAPAWEGDLHVVSTRDGRLRAVARGVPVDPGRHWNFELSGVGFAHPSWIEISLQRTRDDFLDDHVNTFWAVYNGIGDDSRVLAHATLRDRGELVWHCHPALMPDSATDAGDVLLALAEHLAMHAPHAFPVTRVTAYPAEHD